MNTSRKKIHLFIFVVIALITISCICSSVPGLDTFLAEEPTATVHPTEIPTLPPTPTTEPTKEVVVPPTEAPEEPTEQPAEPEEPANFEILSDTSFSSDDWHYIVGEIINNTDAPMSWIKISVLIKDEDDNVIATDYVYPMLDIIPAGGTSPFTISSDEWGTVSTYEFVIEEGDEDTLPATGLEIIYHTSYEDDYAFYVIGEIQNNSDTTMSWVNVVGGLYDDDGLILFASYSYTMLDYIPPGGKTPFRITFYENYENEANYEVQVQGDEDTQPAPVLELVSHETSVENDWCEWSGVVKNISSDETSFTTLVISYYDADGLLVNTDWTFTNGDAIPAGATDTFDSTTYYCPEYDHYTIQIDQ